MNEHDDYALVVGIDRYADAGAYKPLQGARNDAADFLEWLREHGNLTPDHVDPFTFLSDDNGTRPTLHDLVEAVKKILALSPNGDKRIGRRLYIFLTGHGVGPSLDEAGLLTVEATELAPSYFPGRFCANLFRAGAFFNEIILCMDCCRDFDLQLPPAWLPIKVKHDVGAAHRVKRFYAYASGPGRKARETDFGGTTHGIFSRALIDGLRGEAVDGDGCISGLSLERYVRKMMVRYRPLGSDQDADFHVDHELVFAEGLPPKTATVTMSLAEPEKGFVVLRGNRLKPMEVKREDLASGKQRVHLPVGKTYVFRVLDEQGKTLREDSHVIEDTDEEIHVQL